MPDHPLYRVSLHALARWRQRIDPRADFADVLRALRESREPTAAEREHIIGDGDLHVRVWRRRMAVLLFSRHRRALVLVTVYSYAECVALRRRRRQKQRRVVCDE